MVEKYKKENYTSLCEFVKHNVDDDFYLTENNSRLTIKDDISLKKLIKQCSIIMIIENRGDVMGAICLWKSFGNNVCRYYVKLNAMNESIADSLIKVFLWNVKKDVYIKIKKDSKFYKVLRNNKFEFFGSRGKELLLCHKTIIVVRDTGNNYGKEN